MEQTKLKYRMKRSATGEKTYPVSLFKVVAMREAYWRKDEIILDNPVRVADFYNRVIATDERYTGDVETFSVIHLTSRRRCIGWQVLAHGTLDTILVHPREVFRGAIVANSAAIVCCHNHPSGEATPSEADIKVTRDLISASRILKIELLDHVIIGTPTEQRPTAYTSLRELGYFFA